MEINFIILSPEPNLGRLKGTIRSIRNNYDTNSNIICSVSSEIKKNELEEFREICTTHKGGNTITSLINRGIKNSNEGWCMFIVEGAWLPRNIKSRYEKWVKKDSDILFPIFVNYDRQGIPIKIFNKFEDCTLNGILMHKNFFKKIGKFSENPLNISRRFWAYEALEKGAEFKAILGIKIC